jgi:hypothetical protein
MLGSVLCGWALQFDDIAIRVNEVQRRTIALRAEVFTDRTQWLDAKPTQVGDDNFGVEGFDAQAQMVDVPTLAARAGTACGTQATGEGYQVDQRFAGAQVHKAKIVASLDHVAAEHALVKRDTSLHIGDAKDEVINVFQCKGQHCLEQTRLLNLPAVLLNDTLQCLLCYCIDALPFSLGNNSQLLVKLRRNAQIKFS